MGQFQFAELEALSRAPFGEEDTLSRALDRQRELDALLGVQAEDRAVDLSSLDVAEAEPEHADDLGAVS